MKLKPRRKVTFPVNSHGAVQWSKRGVGQILYGLLVTEGLFFSLN